MYNLFISHSWNYSDAYDKLISLLNDASYFSYKNFSVPKDDPLRIHNTVHYRSELMNKIKNQMKYCSAVLILAGVYATYSDSINMEISVAQELGKPIIAIEPWRSEKTSVIVKNAARSIVHWNTDSIVSAIREVSK